MFSGRPFARDLNELGYPGKSPTTPKPPGEYRVCMLGGSTVVVGNPPIAQLLEQMFHDAGMHNVRVYNFGVISSVSGMEVAKIVFEIADLSADLILMYNGGNDILAPYSWDPRPGYPFNFVAYEGNPLLESTPADYPGLTLLAYESVLMRRLFPSYFLNRFVDLDRVRHTSGYQTDKWKRQIADTYVANVFKAHHVSTAFKAEFIAFFQPLLYFKETLTDEEAVWAGPEQADYAKQLRGLILERIAQIRETNKIRVVDLSGIFAGDKRSLFTDVIHTRQIAMPEVAQGIFEGIKLQHVYR